MASVYNNYESLCFECVVDYACSQIWKQQDPLEWLKRIKEITQCYNLSGDLADKTWLCLLLVQLHTNLKCVENGSRTFCNAKKFCESFSRISRLFPFSRVETECMKKKVLKWVSEDKITVSECQVYINETKQFLRPIYKKMKNSKLQEAYKVYEKKLKRNGSKPTSETLKNVFLWKYDGSSKQGRKNWEEVIRGTHPDVIQLKRKQARKLNVPKKVDSIQNQNNCSYVDVIDSLPGCLVPLHDVKKAKVGKGFIIGSKKGKEPMHLYRNASSKTTVSKTQRLNFTNSNSDHSDVGKPVSFESSEGVIDPSSDNDTNSSVHQKKKSISNLSSPAKQGCLEGEPSAPHFKKKGVLNKTRNYTVTKCKKQKLIISDDDSTTDDEPEIIRLARSAKELSSTLSQATENLMGIVKDPYNIRSSDDSEITCPKKGKVSKWIAPQRNAAVLTWSSSDRELDDEAPKIIELLTPKMNKRLLNLAGEDQNDAAGKPKTKQKKRRRYWSMDEMQWIREGVKTYGKGSWAQILANYPFVNRTSVDIKDKFRNMVKNAEI